MRQIVDLKGLEEKTPFTKHQIYKLVKRSENPLPHKKVGVKLYFDLEKIERWFDSLPGKDETFGCERSCL